MADENVYVVVVIPDGGQVKVSKFAGIDSFHDHIAQNLSDSSEIIAVVCGSPAGGVVDIYSDDTVTHPDGSTYRLPTGVEKKLLVNGRAI
jgi:hypothetical protein